MRNERDYGEKSIKDELRLLRWDPAGQSLLQKQEYGKKVQIF